MDVLLDTNILIHIAQKEKDFLKIYKVTKKSNVTFWVHELSLEELKKNKPLLQFQQKYSDTLKMMKIMPLDQEADSILKDGLDNDKVDDFLLKFATEPKNNIAYLVTEDTKLRNKSGVKRYKVINTNEFIGKFVSENSFQIISRYFKDVDVNNGFFNSFRILYKGFNKWFTDKKDEQCFICYDPDSATDIIGFAAYKIENGNIMKIRSFKTCNSGIKLGELLLKKIFDAALENGIEEIFVTLWDKGTDEYNLLSEYEQNEIDNLKRFLLKWGFTENGKYNGSLESKFSKIIGTFLKNWANDLQKNYPNFQRERKVRMLSIYQDYAKKLFPDFKIRGIHSSDDFYISTKYITMGFPSRPNVGEFCLVYQMTRDTANKGTKNGIISIVQICKIKQINSFSSFDEFKSYCRGRTVFDDKELWDFWNNHKNEYVIDLLFVKKMARNLWLGEIREKVGKISMKTFSLVTDKDYNIIKGLTNTQIIYALHTK